MEVIEIKNDEWKDHQESLKEDGNIWEILKLTPAKRDQNEKAPFGKKIEEENHTKKGERKNAEYATKVCRKLQISPSPLDQYLERDGEENTVVHHKMEYHHTNSDYLKVLIAEESTLNISDCSQPRPSKLENDSRSVLKKQESENKFLKNEKSNLEDENNSLESTLSRSTLNFSDCSQSSPSKRENDSRSVSEKQESENNCLKNEKSNLEDENNSLQSKNSLEDEISSLSVSNLESKNSLEDDISNLSVSNLESGIEDPNDPNYKISKMLLKGYLMDTSKKLGNMPTKGIYLIKGNIYKIPRRSIFKYIEPSLTDPFILEPLSLDERLCSSEVVSGREMNHANKKLSFLRCWRGKIFKDSTDEGQKEDI